MTKKEAKPSSKFTEKSSKLTKEILMVIRLIFKEIKHRKINFLLALASVIIASTLYITFQTTGKTSEDETRKLMLELGQNLRIIPKQTRMDRFWMNGFSEYTMPQEYVYRFAEKSGYSYTHLTATLHQAIQWNNMTVILTGILPEVFPPDKRWQKPMTFSVDEGTAYVGYEVADGLEINNGDIIRIKNKDLKVIKTLSQTGSSDDIRIYSNLKDAQDILDLPGRINEIKALECMCFVKTNTDPLVAAREELADLLPEGKVMLLEGIADIRFKQRTSIQKHMNFIMLATLIGCGIMIGILAMMNVRDRKREIGLMTALGHSGAYISALFFGKALLTGVIGAVFGFGIGTGLAIYLGPEIFSVSAGAGEADFSLLKNVLIWTPAFVIISSLIPIVIAITNDPAVSLRED